MGIGGVYCTGMTDGIRPDHVYNTNENDEKFMAKRSSISQRIRSVTVRK